MECSKKNTAVVKVEMEAQNTNETTTTVELSTDISIQSARIPKTRKGFCSLSIIQGTVMKSTFQKLLAVIIFY